jgi:hypothetical protein
MALDEEALRQQLAQEVDALMTPIDIEALRAEGILGKRIGAWYEVLDMARLPEHARKQIRTRQDSISGDKPPMVTFMKVTKRLKRLHKKLHGCSATVEGGYDTCSQRD